MKFPIRILSAKAEDGQHTSGGRGAGQASAAGSTPDVPVADALPFDHEDFRSGVHVLLVLPKGNPIPGFRDPVYGFMDAAGVKLPEGLQPTGWKPL